MSNVSRLLQAVGDGAVVSGAGGYFRERERAAPLKLKSYETIARYVLGAIYLHGAVDGVLQIVFHVYYTGRLPADSFVGALEHTPYFWTFMKLCELIGAFSLLVNYKPVLGFALVTPISVVLCLFYIFDMHAYIFLGLVLVSSLILLNAYRRSFAPLLDDYA